MNFYCECKLALSAEIKTIFVLNPATSCINPRGMSIHVQQKIYTNVFSRFNHKTTDGHTSQNSVYPVWKGCVLTKKGVF